MSTYRITFAACAFACGAASVGATESAPSQIPNEIDFTKPVQISFKYEGFTEGTVKALKSRLLKQGFNVTTSEASSSSASQHQWRVDAVKAGKMQRAEAAALLSSRPVPQEEPGSSFTWSVSQTQ